MAKPVIPQKSPYVVDVEEGKKYYWCSCGKSSTQPFAMVNIKKTKLISSLFHLSQKNLEKFIYVAVNTLRLLRIVMALIKI